MAPESYAEGKRGTTIPLPASAMQTAAKLNSRAPRQQRNTDSFTSISHAKISKGGFKAAAAENADCKRGAEIFSPASVKPAEKIVPSAALDSKKSTRSFAAG
jgi:hypothetical protein